MTSRRRRRSLVPRWLRHRTLVLAEAVLLANAGREYATRAISPALPNWGKVLLTMALAVGVFGGLFYLIDALTAKTVAKTHDAVRAVPVPMPVLLVHVAMLIGLFLLYAWVWEITVP